MDLKPEEFVNVAVRVRPSLNVLEDSVAIKVVSEHPPVLHAVNRQSYTFNHIFTPEASQEVVYNDIVKPLVEKVLLGYNSTVFAYGQTGTGKTYTMGSDPKIYSDPGFILRTFREIFAHQDQHKELEVYVSFYEIYNEKVYDLFTNSTKSLLVKGFKVEGLAQLRVYTSKEAQNLLDIGSRNRHVGETKLNKNSSRSHAIFTVYCNIKNEKIEIEAKLNLVDLAGSENARKTGNEGFQFQEGININMGLFNVRRVISALSANTSHVPYRESMITTILQDSLSRTNYVTLIACISPDLQDINETIQTLDFAQGAKKLRNKPEVNDVVQRYKKQNPSLFERPLLTNSSSKQRTTPLKRQYNSFECPTSTKKTKVINNTWTPMSTIGEPQLQNFSKEPAVQIPFPTISPIVRKCAEVLERSMMEKFETLLKTHSRRIDEKEKTPSFSRRELQAEVSTIVRNEIARIEPRLRACSSPIEAQNNSCISGPFPVEQSCITSVAKRLDFDDTVFKEPKVPTKKSSRRAGAGVPLRRSTRLSTLPNVDVQISRRRSTRLLEKKNSPPRSHEFANVTRKTPVPAPRKLKKVENKSDLEKKHCKYILSILNEGGEKELMKLPSIGPKTATQIYFYRQLNGPFRSIEDMSKMETWRKSAYQRFLKANFLIDCDLTIR